MHLLSILLLVVCALFVVQACNPQLPGPPGRDGNKRPKGMPENSGHQEKQGSFKLPGQPGGVGVVGRRGLRGPQGDQSTKEI
ncbi:Complement C1q tumor necrosis factor-related protein [Dirofilaria immitis]